MAGFSISSYNCKNFSSVLRYDFISSMFVDNDFICLQEHHLFESEFQKFSNLCGANTVMYSATSAMDIGVFHRGRKFGGTAILWKSNIKFPVSVISTLSKRLSAVNVVINDKTNILIFCVYMPCDEGYRGEGFQEYQDILSEISTICQQQDASHVCVAGDFNTDFARNTPHTQELFDFCDTETLFPLIKSSCSNVKHTFETAGGSITSCIDHIIVSENLAQCVKSYSSIDNTDNFSDHIPVVAKFDLVFEYIDDVSTTTKPRTLWYRASIRDIENYKSCLESSIQVNFGNLQNTVLDCVNVSCENPRHVQQLSELYSKMIECCIDASCESIPQGGSSGRSKRTPVPGFSEHCKPKRDIAIYWHNAWKDQGRPREGYYAEMRRRSRADYHQSVKMVKLNERLLRSQRMGEAHTRGHQQHFWSQVKRVNGKSRVMPSTIDGLTDPVEISELFADKYKTLYNSVDYKKEDMSQLFEAVQMKITESAKHVNDALFTIDDISRAIKHVKNNKYDGYMGLYSDHIINSTPSLHKLLVKLYNSMLVHGCCVGDMLLGTLSPLTKDKRASLSNSENFRSICLQTVLCKLMDLMIMHRESKQLCTSNMQFGFKPEVSTSVAMSVLQETIDYYTQDNGNVFGLALDASKAFDRVQYVQLFRKLCERDINPLYVRILIQMYTNQKLRVVYNNNASAWFNVTNGVKQGGVISPTLFSVYIDGMLNAISSSKLGCHIGNVCTGIIAYADDVILLAPTVHSLKNMVKACEDYASKHYIKFNGTKSQMIVFGDKEYIYCPEINVNNEKVPLVQEIKYLGHTVKSNVQDANIKCVKVDFIAKVNAFLANFAGVTSNVKSYLFSHYCMSFYGSNACMMYDKSFNELKVAWRKAIRRVWGLPFRTHGSILPHICNTMPCEITLYKRFVKHFLRGYNHSNPDIANIFMSAICNNSRMFQNLKHIAAYCKTSYNSLLKMDPQGCVNLIDTTWLAQVVEHDVLNGQLVKDVCDMRDELGNKFFTNHEIDVLLNFLCTSF